MIYRAKKFLDKLFLLFEKGVKDNIIIIFTFADDFDNVQNLTAFKTLNDKESPLRNILGPIENLPHFEFNNLAYLTSNISKFTFDFDKCRTNFDKLLKYVSNLKPISLKETVKVLEDRSIISVFIKVIYIDMTDVIQRIAILMEKRKYFENGKKRLEGLKESDNIFVKKIVQEKVPIKEKYIDDDHSVRTRIVYHVSNRELMVVDPAKKATEEQKKKQREDINKDLEENKKEIEKLDNGINKTLNISLNKLKEIATKENQLNKIALKTYENYGYSKKILDESFQEIKNEQTKDDAYSEHIEYSNKIKKVFNNTFSRIDSISSNEDIIKEMKDELFPK